MERTSDTNARLIRALRRSASTQGVEVTIEPVRVRPWHSATFSGSRHILAATLAACPATDTWLASLGEAELWMPDQIAADVIVAGRSVDGALVIATIEALTIAV